MISADLGRLGALTIELYDVGATPMTGEQLAAFSDAAALWEGILLDPITVKINVQFEPMESSSILGSTFSVPTTHSYTTARSALLAASDSIVETGVLGLLPATKIPLTDTDGFREDTKLTITAANAKVLGLGTAMDPMYGCPPEIPCPLENSADAFITFNTLFNFDYDRSDGVSPSKHDFVTVACHEIGHALGFTSTTDVQDAYPAYNLHPTALDLWRFEGTGSGHDLTTEARFMTAGDAEFYNTKATIETSWGVEVTDPICGTSTDRCQASHWRDDLGNLMDPTLAPGIQEDPRPNDRYAMNYIGYRTFSVLIYNPKWFQVGWFPLPEPWPCLTCPPIPDFAGKFSNFPEPPPYEELPRVPFRPNLGMRLGMDLGIKGFESRSGLGLAEFVEERPNPDIESTIRGLPLEDGENLHPPVIPLRLLPPAILHFAFLSDKEGGPALAFKDTLAEGGAHFDPALGRRGGYRITGVLDGAGDRTEGDVDARLVFLLLAEDGAEPDGKAFDIFHVAPGDGESSIEVLDPVAFELRLIGGIQKPGDCNQDGNLDIADPICLLGHLFLGMPAALPCEGGTIADPGNASLLNSNGDAAGVNLADAIHVLQYLFGPNGAPPALGTSCVPIAGCPDNAAKCAE
jgi:hypothetical protein